jgi:hypothetical protein
LQIDATGKARIRFQKNERIGIDTLFSRFVIIEEQRCCERLPSRIPSQMESKTGGFKQPCGPKRRFPLCSTQDLQPTAQFRVIRCSVKSGCCFGQTAMPSLALLKVDVVWLPSSKITRNAGLEFDRRVSSPRAFLALTEIAANGQLVSHLLLTQRASRCRLRPWISVIIRK